MRRNDIEREARKLLEANAVTRAPVPVEQLANALHIDVRFSAGSEDVSGALIRNGESVVIAVNSSQHENRQRFTIAHELGHYLLHKGTKLHFDEDFRINYRDATSSDATKREEVEANGFAAALLMPQRILMRDWLRLERNDKEIPETIRTLANRYRVSHKAMELRLVNLGFISPVE
ncbi:MAG TPA: ImmA/IrrE family metallo-endopeptidase [Terriglobales bacterium]|jgi:Zn-dependent peptidase ImmA (M78 family)|nr:ImmA/IrrE family metallo-endopeptidase [Terriglobales bacterium]